MRIGLLTKEYPPQIYGGAGVHVRHLTRELAALDGGCHEIKALAFGEQDDTLGNLSVAGMEASSPLPFPVGRHEALFRALMADIRMAASLEDVDIVHCHTWYTHWAGCLLRNLLDVPLVLTTHSLEAQRPWKAEQLGTGYAVSEWIERKAYQDADGVIAVSSSVRDDVCALYGVSQPKVRVIPNGIDTATWHPTPNPTILLSYGIDPGRPLVLFVGRLTRQKGIVHLLDAIPALRANAQILLCASDPDAPEVEREIGTKIDEVRRRSGRIIVWIRQTLPEKDLVCLHTHASVFVCPSIYEPFGITNLEAMACETPVVASAIGGIREVVVDGETGLLVPLEPLSAADPTPADPEGFARGLAAAIEQLLRSPKRAQDMGIKGRRRVEAHFGWRRAAERTLAFYEELVHHHRERRTAIAVPARGGASGVPGLP